MNQKWLPDCTGVPAPTTLSITSIVSDMLLDNNFLPHVTVTNTGDRSGEVVVLGFVTSSHPRFPRQKLFDFQRVGPLAPGESVLASLQLQRGSEAETLAVMDDDGHAWLEPAQFTVSMGDVVAPAVFGFTVTVGRYHPSHPHTCASVRAQDASRAGVHAARLT